MTRIQDSEDPDDLADKALAGDLDEFFLYPWLQPGMSAQLMRSGFLPMSVCHLGLCFLLPKLHRLRSVLFFDEIRPRTSVRRRARSLVLTANREFDACLESCARVHGEDWLSPGLRSLFSELYRDPPLKLLRLHSIEAWDKDERCLCAGEIGYSYGMVYTSLSGFYAQSGAGSVQLLATAGLLRGMGVDFWDLGMPLAYKSDLGARELGRGEFLSALRHSRAKAEALGNVLELSPSREEDAISLIDSLGGASKSGYSPRQM